ncbi:hypothetical protein WJX73_005513 [Symbiochloris irregularis]|uniref:Solute carrier family 40 member n=1 Tax=Symbiochloris irregularis TaxID=706552 RepID=A0AAW1PZS9_9CHLO
MWEFALALIMLNLHPGTLLWVAIAGLANSMSSVVFGASVGSFLDRTPRLNGAAIMYCTQNLGITLSACASLAALALRDATVAFLICNIVAVGAAATAAVGALGSTIAVEKDWVAALHRETPGQLAHVNSVMRRIDLVCLIASPIASGFVMTYAGLRAAILVIIGWNLLGWLPEVYVLSHAMELVPELKHRMSEPSSKTGDSSPSEMPPWWRKIHPGQQLAAWQTYFRQPIWPAALSLALLYLTVLSLGSLMTAYLNWRGMSEAKLSIFRGLGAVTGVASTFSFPWLHSRIGLDATGLLGIVSQLVCLVVAVVPAALGHASARLDTVAATYLLACGLALSRFGLWTFDLAVSQRLQADVASNELGVVNVEMGRGLVPHGTQARQPLSESL